ACADSWLRIRVDTEIRRGKGVAPRKPETRVGAPERPNNRTTPARPGATGGTPPPTKERARKNRTHSTTRAPPAPPPPRLAPPPPAPPREAARRCPRPACAGRPGTGPGARSPAGQVVADLRRPQSG